MSDDSANDVMPDAPAIGKPRRPVIAPWAVLASDVWWNRKIRRAGPNGSLVFFFALTMNAAKGRRGFFPAAELDPWFVAEATKLSEADAKAAVESAVTAGLLAIEADKAVIVGWAEEWSRSPISESDARQNRRLAAKLRDQRQTETETKTKKKSEKGEGDSDIEETGLRPDRRPDRTGPSPGTVRTSGTVGSKPSGSDYTPEERKAARTVLDYLTSIKGVKYEGEASVQIVVDRIREGRTVRQLAWIVAHAFDPNGLNWQKETRMTPNLEPHILLSKKHVDNYIATASTPRAWEPWEYVPFPDEVR